MQESMRCTGSTTSASGRRVVVEHTARDFIKDRLAISHMYVCTKYVCMRDEERITWSHTHTHRAQVSIAPNTAIYV